MMVEENDNLKIVLFFIVFVLFVFSVISVHRTYQGNKILAVSSSGDVKVTKSQYESYKDLFGGDYVGFRVCSIKNGDCVNFVNIENYEDYMGKLDGDTSGS